MDSQHSFRQQSLLAAQDWRQMPKSIQLLQKQTPSLWEPERGTECNGPAPQALNPFVKRSQGRV